MSLRIALTVILLASPSAAIAQQASEPAAFAITPHIGVTSESAFVDGPIVFSDGGVDYVLVEPRTGVLLGLELSYWFSKKLAGVLALSYATADARYIENNDLRRDVGIDTLRIQPGVMVNVLGTDKFGLDVGGGLTIARISLDSLVWNDRVISPSSTAIGLFGAAGIDVTLTPRLSFHSHLMLELSRPSYGDFEDEIARADGETGADVDHNTRAALILAIGLSIGL